MGALVSKLWPNRDAGPDSPDTSEQISKYPSAKYLIKDVSIASMSIKYTSPKFALTGKPLNTEKFERVLSLHRSRKQVEIIELRKCEWVQRIPVTIEQYTSLTELDLHGSNIEVLPWALVRLKKTLKKLNLGNNAVEYVPRFIGRLVNLTELDLSGNCISDVPSELLDLTELVVLKLEQNPNLNFPSAAVCQRGKEAVFEALESRKARTDLWRHTRTAGEGQYGDCEPQQLQDICCTCIIRYGVAFNEPPGLLPAVLTKHLLQLKDTYFKVAKCSACSGYFSSEDTFDRHVCKR